MKSIPEILAEELGQKLEYVQNVVNLMDEGNTIPFIARYRKEQTGSLDDQLLREIYERLQYLRGLDKRISQRTGLEVQVAEDPLRAVVRGTGIVLKNLDKYNNILIK